MFSQNQAVFDDFRYRGEDISFSRNINTETERYNPIISGFYPDPSDTVPKSVSVPVKKEHSLKTLLFLQITITNNKIQRLCYYQRNSFLP
jgi:hypothetical protein